MGEQYLSPPPFDLAGSHADSSVSQPLVFVLSPGSDPMAALLYFAETVKKKVDSISLGQGQVCVVLCCACVPSVLGVLGVIVCRAVVVPGGDGLVKPCFAVDYVCRAPLPTP
jgi:hypothetical protein